MKVLINATFKALRFGAFVTASAEADEFILDTENCEQSKATLKEIVEKNKVEGVGKKDTVQSICEKIELRIEELDLPEQNEMSDTDFVKQVISDGMANGDSDEEMLIALLGRKIKYKLAKKMFETEMAEGGYRLSGKKRKEAIRNLLVEIEFDPDGSYATWSEMVLRITDGDDDNEAIPDTETSQAYKAMKAYCKEFELDIPKPPKKEKGGFSKACLVWMLKNPTASNEDLEDFITGEKKKGEKAVVKQVALFEFAKKFAEAFINADDEDLDDDDDDDDDED